MASPGGGYPQAGEVSPGCSFNAEDEKHFKAHKREKRFDAGHKFGCLQGHTATSRRHGLWGRQTWRSACMEDEEEELRVERPETEEGTGVSALDLRPELFSSTPVKQGLTEELCEELQQLCVSSSIHRHPENPDFAVRVFELPVVGHRLGQEIVKTEEQVRLYSPPARPSPGAMPPVFATLRCSPPEDVQEKTLLQRAKLNWKGCADVPTKRSDRLVRVRPRYAPIKYIAQHHLINNRMCFDCWIQDGPESFLEVDLGADCSVTHVSTAGRFPPTIKYPCPELQKQWSLETGKDVSSYNREAWVVVRPEAPGWEEWVTRYELRARSQGGRTWETIATLKGNADMTTEVAHDLRQVCHNPDGLQCRFLRFVPLSFHGKAALRIGVYGLALEKEPTEVKPPKEDGLVRYLVPVPLTNRNRRRHERDFVSRRNYSPDYYGKYGEDHEISTRRKQRQRETLRQAAEALGKDRKALILRQDSALYESDVGKEDDQVEGEALRPPDEDREGNDAKKMSPKVEETQPERPKLQRATSRRIEEALTERPMLQRTRTDDERGYCSEPEELLADWVVV